MDGFELAERIQADPSISTSLALMLSSQGHLDAAARCRAMGIEQYVTKPLRQSDLLAAILAAVANGDAHVERTPRRVATPGAPRYRILLAEDNPVNQYLGRRMVEQLGHDCVVAGNGIEALRALEHVDFDLVLMDVQMPELTGVEATVAVRRRELGTGRHLAIIAATAHELSDDRERFLAAGMDGYAAKPLRSADLESVIAEVMGRKGPGSASPEGPAAAPFAALLDRMGGNEKLFGEVVDLLAAEAPKALSGLRDALARGDAEAVREGAHKLRGMIANFGAEAAVTSAGRLEDAGRLADLGEAPALLAGLESAVEHTLGALSAYRSSQRT